MYLEYFSLQRHPFRITPDPSLFFPGGTHGRGVVLDALVYGITSGEGILKVVGEVGSGKTMLCRMLEERLPEKVEIVYLANPSLSAREIVYAIAIELKLDVDASTDRLLVMHKLQEYLLCKHSEGGSVVVFIEEAQSMPLETLEEIRLLSNLETHRHKLMQIVLFGQPELDRKLEQKSIRQLRERITHSFHLDPLTLAETREYLHFRLQSAGCPWPHLFSPKAEELLAKASTGLTRRINILADKALLASYADPATRPQPRNSAGEIQPMVLPRHVKVAIADSGYKNFAGSHVQRLAGYVGATLGGGLLVAGGFWFWSSLEEDRSQPLFRAALMEQAEVATINNRTPNESTADTTSSPVAVIPDTVVESAPIEIPVTDSAASQIQVAEEATNTAPPTTTQMSPSPELAKPLVEEPPEVAVMAMPEAGESPVSADLTSVNDTAPATPEAQPLSKVIPQSYQNLPGLIRVRAEASISWLQALPQKAGYSVQLFSAPTGNTVILEEYLEFLELTDMLDSTYLCLISGNARRSEQWLVLHGEYPGLSAARSFIARLPPYVRQHSPYARNLDGIACANEGI